VRFVVLGRVLGEPERVADLAQHCRARNGDARARGIGHGPREHAHRFVELLDPAPAPRRRQAPERLRLPRLYDRREAVEQRELLHPRSREGVEREHVAHVRIARERRLPARDILGFVAPGLVEEHEDGLAHPLEHRELGCQVACVLRILGGVDEVEHDVGVVAHRPYSALGEEERAIAKPVPDFGEEPADGTLLLREPPREARAVRRIPACPTARGCRLPACRRGERGRFGRDVRRIAHLADVAREERSRERGLARVGVGDERQRDRAHVASAASNPASAAAASGFARSTNTGVRPASAAISRHSERRSSRRAASFGQ
jgi:hypothetical protein